MSVRPLEPGDVVSLRRAATRFLGSGLLVNTQGAAGSVEALVGTGPDLYAAFGHGLTISEAVAELAASTGQPVEAIEPHVLEFAQRLVDTELAEPPT